MLDESTTMPEASSERDLPGYVPKLGGQTSGAQKVRLPESRGASGSRCFYQVPGKLFLLIFLSFAVLQPVEGCLPSWFRDERSPTMALEGSGEIDASSLYTPESVKESQPEYVRTNKITAEDDELYEDEDSIYGTAAPIHRDEKLIAAEKRHALKECRDYCYHNGECVVEVDEKTHSFRHKRCDCPVDYWGPQCEYPHVRAIYEPSRRDWAEVEKSSVPALVFFLLLIFIVLAVFIYAYKKMFGSMPKSASEAAECFSLKHHLRRRQMLYDTPRTMDATPNSGASESASCPNTPRTPFSRAVLPTRSNRTPYSVTGSLSVSNGRINTVSTEVSSRLGPTLSLATTENSRMLTQELPTIPEIEPSLSRNNSQDSRTCSVSKAASIHHLPGPSVHKDFRSPDLRRSSLSYYKFASPSADMIRTVL